MSELLTRKEAAARAKICLRNLAGRIANGTGPEITKIGRRIFINEQALADWIKAHTVQPAAKA